MNHSAGKSTAALCSVLLAIAAVPLPANAQIAGSLDIGGNRLRFADTLELTAATASASVAGRWPRASLNAWASFSRLDESASTTQGLGSLSLFTQPVRFFSGELAALAGGSTHSDGTNTGMVLGIARAHLNNAMRGLWIGGGAGSSSDGSRSRATRLGELGAWLQLADAVAAITATPTVVEDTIRYTDFQLSLGWLLPRVELSATGGARSGRGLHVFSDSPDVWGSVGAVVWLARHVGIAAGAGRYPVDLTQGYPGGSYASLSLRLGTTGARRAPMQLRDPGIDARAAAAGITRFTVTSASGRTRLIRVHAPNARSVEISGDFTLWEPVAMARSTGGWWTLQRNLAPGTYEVNVRADGGEWLAPPGLPPLRDEFGWVVGVLTID